MTRSDNYADGRRLANAVSRYDLLLLVIPLAFLLGVVASGLSSLSVRAALTGASLVGALAVADALFLNPPSA